MSPPALAPPTDAGAAASSPAVPTVADASASGAASSTIAPVVTAIALAPAHQAGDVDMLRVWCYVCGLKCDICSAKVFNKTNGTWKCKVCNSKATTLYREFGTWPTSDFQSASLLMREAGSKDKLALIRSAKMFMT